MAAVLRISVTCNTGLYFTVDSHFYHGMVANSLDGREGILQRGWLQYHWVILKCSVALAGAGYLDRLLGFLLNAAQCSVGIFVVDITQVLQG